ncbi:MAG TPA: chemotaxis protein CheW [Patescibacteria group bacterium]|nr:chemotaxis protein CheW [Patescibacteria group bacterium]
MVDVGLGTEPRTGGRVATSEEVLAVRARVLARPMETGPREQATTQLLGFEAGGDRFALPADAVVTVIAGVVPTFVPHLPSWMAGAMDVRGRVVAVASPDQFLGTTPPLEDALLRSTAIVVACASAEVAFLIDRLEPVEAYGSDAIVVLPVGASSLMRCASRGTIDGRIVLDPAGLIKAIRSALDQYTLPSSSEIDQRPTGPAQETP